jgi:hypothetical protein
VVEGQALSRPAAEAAGLLALAGQDVEAGDDRRFRIARGVAKDRVISTVDPRGPPRAQEPRPPLRRLQGAYEHRSRLDSEIIDEVVVTPANAHDATAVTDLLVPVTDDEAKPTVMGDSAYAGAATLDDLEAAGFADVLAKVPPARGREGRLGKEGLRRRPRLRTCQPSLDDIVTVPGASHRRIGERDPQPDPLVRLASR